jgi:hypothetical protein
MPNLEQMDSKQRVEMVKFDDFVKSPISAFPFIPRHCGVLSVRLIPRDSGALISNFLQSRLKADFLRFHQV